MTNAAKLLLNPDAFKLRAELTLKSNGNGAKSAPVRIVANTGSPVDFSDYGLGQVVFDFASMTHKPRIPLDYSHEDNAIGYLNKIEVTPEWELICAGAVTPAGDPEVELLLAKMEAGVPYQASIEAHGGTLELIQPDEQVVVNGRSLTGPLFVVRDWTLAAVAVCKFGRDAETSAELRLAAAKKSATTGKVLFVAQANKGEAMENTEQKNVEQSAAVEAAAVEQPKTEAVVEQPQVEAEAKNAEVVDEEKGAEAVADQKTEQVQPVAEAVDAVEDVEADAALVAAVAKATGIQTADAVDASKGDPREEFRRFVAAFGDQAAKFYADGKSFTDAQAEYVAHLKKQNDDLKKRLAATDRGADRPVKFTDSDTPKKAGLEVKIRGQ